MLVCYGSITPRRDKLLKTLSNVGVKTTYLHGVYQGERNSTVFRARAVLNPHKLGCVDGLGCEPVRAKPSPWRWRGSCRFEDYSR